MAALERSLELRPAWPEATFNLGVAYELAGSNAEAARAFREFLSGAGAADADKRAEAERKLAALDLSR